MLVSRPAWTAVATLLLLGPSASVACSNGEGGGAVGGGPPGYQAGSPNTSGGASSGASSSSAGVGGSLPLGGSVSGGAATGGNAGATLGGAAGSAGNSPGGAGGMGVDPEDTPPWRPLDVFAAAQEHQHGNAGMDARAKSLGKLAVDIGVNSGGYISCRIFGEGRVAHLLLDLEASGLLF